jgi:sensor histidine kinase YesM
MPKKIQPYLLHLLCCLIFISIPVLSSPDRDSGRLFTVAPFLRDFTVYLLLVAFFYTSYLFFIPQFFFKRKIASFSGLIVVSLLVIFILPKILIPVSFPVHERFHPHHFKQRVITPFEFGHLFLFILVFLLSLLLRITQRLNYLRNEKLKTELSYLKAQINPHFLFNTLNSLYALALAKSDEAPGAILKLSSMMRYVVTESSKDHVALDKEIDYIRNYISLQQLRMDSGTRFTFSVKGNSSGRQISPLILIPFIENAFKYGLNPEKESAIEVYIDINEHELFLNVKNNKVNQAIPEDEASRMGMNNTKQRLQYLYPKKHKLIIFENNTIFDIKLSLIL